MRSIRQKLLFSNALSLLIAFALLGLIGAFGITHLTQFFLKMNADRSQVARANLQRSFEGNIENIRNIYQSQLERKGWSLLLKDSSSVLPMIEDNSFWQLRNFLAENFRDDPELLEASFFVREGNSIRAWQVLTKDYPAGLGLPIEYDLTQGGWVASEKRRKIFIRDPSIRELSQLSVPSVQSKEILDFNPQRERRQQVLDCLIPLFKRNTDPESIERALKRGEAVGFLRYVLSYDRMEETIEAEKKKFESKLAENERLNQSSAELEERETIQLLRQVSYLLGLGVLGAMVLSYLISSTSSTRITSPVKELTRIATRMSEGIYRQTIAVQSDDEIGVLAHSFKNLSQAITRRDEELAEVNRNLEKLVELRTGQLKEQYQTVSGLLHGMKQAVFSVSHQWSVVPPVSKHTDQLFPEGIEGKSILETLFRDLDPRSPEYASLTSGLSVIFGEDEIQWSLMESYFPGELRLGGRTLRVTYHPIWNEAGQMEKLMLAVEDITSLLALQQKIALERASSERNIEVVQELALLDATKIEDFVESSLELLKAAEVDLSVKNTESFLRRVHTLKGSARIFGASTLASRIHLIEKEIREAGDAAALDLVLQRLTEELTVYVLLADRIFRVVAKRQDWDETELKSEFEFLLASVSKTAQSLRKQVEVNLQGPPVKISRKKMAELRGALQHLITNALDHGFNSQQSGLLSISWRVSPSGDSSQVLTIQVSDNGRGIDVETLVSRALERQLLTSQELEFMSREQKLELIFRAGLSTRAVTTEYSGFGQGLAAVKSTLTQLGASIRVSSQGGGGTHFEIHLPLANPAQSAIL